VPLHNLTQAAKLVSLHDLAQVTKAGAIACSGSETLVRFNNAISGSYFGLGNWPCFKEKRHGLDGRPNSVHLNGAKSLAPYDGWQDDIFCSGESKEYIFANTRPQTNWYHDRANTISSDNVYAGKCSI
jgi:hypothetical protein